LEQKTKKLRDQDRTLRDEQIALEKAGASPVRSRSAPEAEALARQLLNGFAPPAGAETADARLHQVRTEREAIGIALDALQGRELQERAVALAQTIQNRNEEWRAIVRERADAVIGLIRANAKAAAFRAEVSAMAAYGPGLICDPSTGIFGPPVVGDQIYTFLKSAVAEGIIRQGDVP